MPTSHAPPRLDVAAFNCPYCNAYAHQTWLNIGKAGEQATDSSWKLYHRFAAIANLKGSVCSHCSKMAIWVSDVLIHPVVAPVDQPSSNLPPKVAAMYREAANVFPHSPRASAGLLRLAIEEFAISQGAKGTSLYDRIQHLQSRGLPPSVHQAFEVLRLTGNNAVHPGQISWDDDDTAALQLFQLVNYIADTLVGLDKMHSSLSKPKKK